VLELWKKDLRSVNERAAEALADPAKYPNLFPDLDWALQVEAIFKAGRGTVVPARSYLTAKEELDLNLIDLVKNANAGNTDNAEEAEVIVTDEPEAETEPAAESEEQPAPASPAKVSAPASPAKATNTNANTSVEEDDLDALIAHADDLLIDDAGAGADAGVGVDADAGEIDLDDLGEDEEAWN
jgi:coatomer subunit beta'